MAPPRGRVHADHGSASAESTAVGRAVEALQPLLQHMSTAQVLRCLEALAAAGHTPPYPWLHDFLAASEALLPRADATEVYGMLAAMRTLRVRPQRPQWADAAAAVLSANLPQLAAPQVVHLLGCLADLALPPPEGLLGRAFALLAPDLPALPPRASLDLLAACSRLRIQPLPHVLAAAYEALSGPALAAAPPAQLCGLAAAMAALRLAPPPGLLSALVARADVLLRASVVSGGVVGKLGGSDVLAAALGGTQTFGAQGGGGCKDGLLGGHRMLRPGRSSRRALGHTSGAAEPASGSVEAAGTGASTAGSPPALTPSQLSCLLRDLRTLAAPVPAEWGQLCGAFLATRTDVATPAQQVLYLMGSVARCGLALQPGVVRGVASRLEAGLRAASRERRRARGLRLRRLAELEPGAAEGPEEEEGEESEELVGTGTGSDGEKVEGGAIDMDGAAALSAAEREELLGQWTPQVLSTAATALVPYASLLPPSLLRALYVNLYDSLERFDLPHLTATLHALPRLAAPPGATPPPAPLLRSYLSCLRGRMPRMQAWQLSMCLFALLRLGVRPDPPWMDALLGQAFRTLPRMNEVQIASVAWVVAKMSYRPAAGWVERLLAAANGRLSCFSPRHLCQLLWAVGAMGYVPDRAWMDRWLDKARGHFRTSDGGTLSALTWALAGLGHRPPDAWLQELCDHLGRRLPHTPPRAVANTLAALAALGYRPGADWLRAVEAHVHSRLGPAAAGGAGAAAGAGGGSGRCYGLRDLACTCHSLARLQHTPAAGWAEAVATAAARLLLLGPGACSAAGPGAGSCDDAASTMDMAAAEQCKYTSLLILALARFRRPPPPDAWRALLDGLHPCLPAATPQSLALLLAAAASLRLPLPREHAGALLLATHRRLGAMSGRALAMVLRGWVELGVHPGPRWLGRLEEVLGRRRELERAWRARLASEEDEEGSGGEEDEIGRHGGPLPPEWLLSPSERCSMLWAVATLETSRLADDSADVSALPSRRPPGYLLPAPQQRPGPSAQSPAGGPYGFPPPPRWERKPGPLRRPLQWEGLLAALLPEPEPEQEPGEASQGRVQGDVQGRGGSSRWRQLAACSGQDLALLCWALGRLRARPPGLLAALLGEVRWRLAQPGEDGAETAAAEASQSVASAARTLGPRELTVTFWGLSSVGVWPSPTWQAAACAEVLRRVRRGELGPRDLATALSALARWRRAPRVKQRRRVLLAAARALPSEHEAQRDRSSGRRGGVASDSGTLHGREQAGRLRRGRLAEARLRATIAELSALALAHSAARMPLPPPPAPMPLRQSGTAVATRAAASVSPGPSAAAAGAGEQTYDARSLATLAWALASLGAVRALPDPWVTAFMPVSLRLLSQLPPSHRVTMLDSLSRLGLRPGPSWIEQAEQAALEGGLALAGAHRGLDLALRRMAGREQVQVQAEGPRVSQR